MAGERGKRGKSRRKPTTRENSLRVDALAYNFGTRLEQAPAPSYLLPSLDPFPAPISLPVLQKKIKTRAATLWQICAEICNRLLCPPEWLLSWL